MKNHHLARGLMIANFEILESWINVFIANHHAKDSVNRKFINEVLENPFFSAHLRKQIVGNILEGTPERKSFIRDLGELEELRNLAAHSLVAVEQNVNGTTGHLEQSGPHYMKYGGKKISQEVLESRFHELTTSLLSRIGVLISTQSKEREVSHQTEKEILDDTLHS